MVLVIIVTIAVSVGIVLGTAESLRSRHEGSGNVGTLRHGGGSSGNSCDTVHV